MNALAPGVETVITVRMLRVVAWQRAMRAADALMEAYPGAVVKPVALRPRPGGPERVGLAAEVDGSSVAGDLAEVRAWLQAEAIATPAVRGHP